MKLIMLQAVTHYNRKKIYQFAYFSLSEMRRWEKVLLTARHSQTTQLVKVLSAPHPMNRPHVDETPLAWLWQSHFQERTRSFCQTSLQSMPKHFPCTAFFMTLLHYLRKPMSQLMQGGGVAMMVVGQSTFPGRVSEAANKFLSHIHFHFDGSGLPSHCRCLAFSQLHFIIPHAYKKKKVHFPAPFP